MRTSEMPHVHFLGRGALSNRAFDYPFACDTVASRTGHRQCHHFRFHSSAYPSLDTSRHMSPNTLFQNRVRRGRGRVTECGQEVALSPPSGVFLGARLSTLCFTAIQIENTD